MEKNRTTRLTMLVVSLLAVLAFGFVGTGFAGVGDGFDGSGVFAQGPPDDNPGQRRAGGEKVGICHFTDDPDNPVVYIEVSKNAVPEHEAHGDVIGVSEEECTAQVTSVPDNGDARTQ